MLYGSRVGVGLVWTLFYVFLCAALLVLAARECRKLASLLVFGAVFLLFPGILTSKLMKLTR